MKTVVKIVTTLTILIVLSSCGSSNEGTTTLQLEKDPPFQISESYAQDWVSGIQNGDAGTKVYIKLSTLPSEVTMLDVYFNDKVAPLKIRPVNSMQYVGYFQNNNNRPHVIMDSNPIKEAANTPPNKSPFQIQQNEAVLSYTVKGNIFFYKIKNLERKETLAYPSSNPKGDN